MATVVICDRCKTHGRQLVPVLGKELCSECISDFGSWVALGVLPERVERGYWSKAIRALLKAHGHCTAEMLADATKKSRKAAHQALRDGVRAKWLGQPTGQNGVWILKSATETDADACG